MIQGKKLGIIGGGNMGEVLVSGIIMRKLLGAEYINVSDVDLNRRTYLADKYGIATTESNKDAVNGSDVVILAVKPQNMGEVLSGIANSLAASTLVISIAAGITTKFIKDQLGEEIRVIRVMPNTPALVGEGATAIAKGSHATDEDMGVALQIFDAIGISVTVKEELLDAVTGLSGSGPAYVFSIIEALSDGGVKMGLARDISLKLSAQTVLGAAKLCLESGKHPAQLKDMVTSPGGTTIAGLKALEDGKLRATIMTAVESATRRSMELGSTS
ncbi:MAG: pyrroline-5-carboxylate reductase [Deltaproteobacteria bacterium]|nr:pyrroline-5-carboxylate reductase [Deltaproteobacteria bacterium]